MVKLIRAFIVDGIVDGRDGEGMERDDEPPVVLVLLRSIREHLPVSVDTPPSPTTDNRRNMLLVIQVASVVTCPR